MVLSIILIIKLILFIQFNLNNTNSNKILNMNTSLENLEEIEALFLLNKHDNDLISELLTKLQSYKGLPEYA